AVEENADRGRALRRFVAIIIFPGICRRGTARSAVEGSCVTTKNPSVSRCASATSPRKRGEDDPLLRLRIRRLVELAFAGDCVVDRGDLLAALDLDLLFVALVDLGDADDMLTLGHAEDRYALRVAAHDADVADRRADHLALVGDQHQRLALARLEGGDDPAVALRRVDVGDALAAAVGAPVFIGRRSLAVAILGDSEDELLVLLQLGIAVVGESALDVLALAPRRAAHIGFALLLRGADAVEDRHG